MAVGLQFYSGKNVDSLKDSLETINFTLKMNNMFDAMNKKFPAEGIRKNSNDLEVTVFMFCACGLCYFVFIRGIERVYLFSLYMYM